MTRVAGDTVHLLPVKHIGFSNVTPLHIFENQTQLFLFKDEEPDAQRQTSFPAHTMHCLVIETTLRMGELIFEK